MLIVSWGGGFLCSLAVLKKGMTRAMNFAVLLVRKAEKIVGCAVVSCVCRIDFLKDGVICSDGGLVERNLFFIYKNFIKLGVERTQARVFNSGS